MLLEPTDDADMRDAAGTTAPERKPDGRSARWLYR
jgi:hypothetical protein